MTVKVNKTGFHSKANHPDSNKPGRGVALEMSNFEHVYVGEGEGFCRVRVVITQVPPFKRQTDVTENITFGSSNSFIDG